MDFVDICTKFNTNVSFNFIAAAMTLQQVNGIDATIMQLRGKGVEVKGIVMLRSHPRTGQRLSVTMFHCLDKNIEVYEVDEPYQKKSVLSHVYDIVTYLLFKKHIQKERVIYVALPDVNFNWLAYIEKNVPESRVQLILIDDGGNSYENKYKAFYQYISCEKSYKARLTMMVKFLFKIPFLIMTRKRLLSSKRLIDDRLFKIQDGKFIRNKEVAKYYDDLYNRIGMTIEKKIVKRFENAVVINTQCLKENNITDGEADFDLYKRLVKVLKKKGIKVIIKTHPRELNPDKYKELDCDVYSDIQYTQESIIASTSIRPICIVSLCSATLLNISGIFDIPAISMAKIFINEYNISVACKSLLNDYIKLYDSTITFPNSMYDVVEDIYQSYRDKTWNFNVRK